MKHHTHLKSKKICLWTSVLIILILSYHLIRVFWFGVPLSNLVLLCTGLTLLLNALSYLKK